MSKIKSHWFHLELKIYLLHGCFTSIRYKPFIDHLLNCSSEKEQCSFILCVIFNMCLIHTIAENATNSTRMQIFKLLKITNKTLCITCTLTVFCMIKLRLCLRIIFFQGDLSWLFKLHIIRVVVILNSLPLVLIMHDFYNLMLILFYISYWYDILY